MPYYVSFGQLQQELTAHYRATGHRWQFPEVIESLRRKNELRQTPTYADATGLHVLDDEAFEAYVDELTFPVLLKDQKSMLVDEEALIPLRRDVFVIRHSRYTRPEPHTHNFWEIDCVTKGSVRLHFEGEVLTLREGAVVLIAPGSLHDIEITDESRVICTMLRRSTFEATFFSLLSRDDALSLFFRTHMRDEQEPNYLLFQTRNTPAIRYCLRYALEECFRDDAYANTCCVSHVNLLLAEVLRDAGDVPQFYRYQAGADFSQILYAIRQNYQTVTLTELCERFHYSKPHLCTLIKQNTGVSFTDLLKQIRMSRASDYLLNTDLPVFEIAEIVGYNSADHFGRVFRGSFKCSPQEYRRTHAKTDDRFVPFERQFR